MKKWITLSLLLTIFPLTAWSDTFCPSNFNSINIGDSLAVVLAACGPPAAKKETKVKPFQAQEWVYFIASSPGMPGTLKTTVAFDANGNVVNMSVNGAGVTVTQICGAQTIQFGDDTKAIEAACGKPSYINQSTVNVPKDVIKTEFEYDSTPPATLIFEDGILKQIKTQ